MTYIEAESQRQEFNAAIKNTTFYSGEYIIPVNNKEEKNVVINLTVADENNYPIKVTKIFSNIEELKSFINVLISIKAIAKSEEYEVEVIPKNNNDLEIYINNIKVDHSLLPTYLKQVSLITKSSIQKEMLEIESLNRQINFLVSEQNNIQRTLNKCETLIITMQNTTNEEKQQQLLKEHTPINHETNVKNNPTTYEIDLKKIIELSHNSLTSNDETLKNQMNEILKRIQIALEDNKKLTIDYEYINSLEDINDLFIIYKFLKTLKIKIINMQDKLIQNIDVKQKILNIILKQINESIKDTKTAPESITNIKIINTKQQQYDFVSDDPFIKEDNVRYDKGKFKEETSPQDEEFKEIQLQQLQKLTPQERDALMYYKTLLSHPINEVMSFIRKDNLTLKDVGASEEKLKYLIDLISNCYDELMNQKEPINFSNIHFLSESQNVIKRLYDKFKNQMPSKKEYIELVLSSIPHLESALKKVTTTKNIIVYRSSPNPNLLEEQSFLSTSLTISSAKSFTSDKTKYKENINFPNIFKIEIPAGSHIIAFTDDLFTDEYNENFIFNEPHYEILIDPINFEFIETYKNSQKVNEYLTAGRVEYKGKQKDISFGNNTSITI